MMVLAYTGPTAMADALELQAEIDVALGLPDGDTVHEMGVYQMSPGCVRCDLTDRVLALLDPDDVPMTLADFEATYAAFLPPPQA